MLTAHGPEADNSRSSSTETVTGHALPLSAGGHGQEAPEDSGEDSGHHASQLLHEHEGKCHKGTVTDRQRAARSAGSTHGCDVHRPRRTGHDRHSTEGGTWPCWATSGHVADRTRM